MRLDLAYNFHDFANFIYFALFAWLNETRDRTAISRNTQSSRSCTAMMCTLQSGQHSSSEKAVSHRQRFRNGLFLPSFSRNLKYYKLLKALLLQWSLTDDGPLLFMAMAMWHFINQLGYYSMWTNWQFTSNVKKFKDLYPPVTCFAWRGVCTGWHFGSKAILIVAFFIRGNRKKRGRLAETHRKSQTRKQRDLRTVQSALRTNVHVVNPNG